MKNHCHGFTFSISKASSADEDFTVISEDRASAESEIRALGIFAGGICVKFKRELDCGVHHAMPIRQEDLQ